MAKRHIPMIPGGLLQLVVLFPPPKPRDYTYFDGSDEHPFEGSATGHSPVNAWWLADFSLLAYEEEARAKAIIARQTSFDPASLHWIESRGNTNTQALFVRGPAGAVLAFRGTEFPRPKAGFGYFGELLNMLKDVATDAQVALVPWVGGDGPSVPVHRGMSDALRSVWDQVEPCLEDVGDNQLWLTGHSLGGSLATLLAYSRPEKLAGLYTFGALPVGGPEFAAEFGTAKDLLAKTCRYVHGKDPVPGLFDILHQYEQVGPAMALPHSRRGPFAELVTKAPEALTGTDPLDHAPLFYCYETWNAFN